MELSPKRHLSLQEGVTLLRWQFPPTLDSNPERKTHMTDMPDFSNVNSGSSSTAVKIHEVKSGDSLSKIAKQEYGDASKWTQIFEANKDILKDPNKIYPGQKLKIPPLA
jgi:nucleoid-associated protein YgaU